MANQTKIDVAKRTFEMDGAVGAVVEIKTASGTVAAKEGHLVVSIGGAWYAYAATVNPLTQEIGDSSKKTYDAVGVLLDESASLSTTASKHRVLYAGRVWEEFVRNAGIASSVVSMDALRTAKGHIVFMDVE